MFVTVQENEKYRAFVSGVAQELGVFQFDPDQIVWHYTNGPGLLGILQSSTIYATQVASLNDANETKYATDLFKVAVQELIAQSVDWVPQFAPDPSGGVATNPLTLALRDGRQILDHPAQLLARSGKAMPVLYSLFPLHDQDKIVGGVVTVRVRAGVALANQS